MPLTFRWTATAVLLFVTIEVVTCLAVKDRNVWCRVTTEGGEENLSSNCSLPSFSSSSFSSTKDSESTGVWKIHVDDVNPKQRVVGFGAAWTDATVTVFDALDASDQEATMRNLFEFSADPDYDAGDALGLRLMRHTIGQSDLTPSTIGEWSYDETIKNVPDPTLTNFSLQSQGERMVEWLVRMRDINPDIVLFGSPWSPPQWMKDPKQNYLLESQKSAWVQYMTRYIREFEKRGIRIDALTPQNEPLHSASTAWTMYMNASTQAELVVSLSAELKKNGLNTSIWIYDHNTDNTEFPQEVLDTCGLDVVRTVAWHCYATALYPKDRWMPLYDFGKKNPNVEQIMTECWTHVGTSEGFFHLPEFIAYPLQMGAGGALAWTLGGSTRYDVSFPDGCAQCSGLVQIDAELKTITRTQDYYTMAHFSKFVSPDARYLNTTGSYEYWDGTGVMANAFENAELSGQRRIVVLQNKIRSPLEIHVHFDSEGENSSWFAEVPARSVVTWVLPPKEN